MSPNSYNIIGLHIIGGGQIGDFQYWVGGGQVFGGLRPCNSELPVRKVCRSKFCNFYLQCRSFELSYKEFRFENVINLRKVYKNEVFSKTLSRVKLLNCFQH